MTGTSPTRLADAGRWLIGGRTGTAAAIQTTIAQIIVLLVNLATGVVTARLLLPEGRGELAAIALLPTMLASLSGIGIPAALIYNLKRHHDDARSLIGGGIVLTLCVGLLSVLVGEAIAPYVLHQYGPDVVRLARWFILTAPLSLVFYICSSIFEAQGKFWYSNATRFLSPVLTFVLLLLFYATHHFSVLTAAISYAVPSLPIGAKMLADVWQRNRPTFARRIEPYRRLLGFGLRSYGIDVMRLLGAQINQLLVVGFLSPAAMGLYVVAFSLASVLQVVQTSINRVLLSRVSAKPLPEVVESVGLAVRITGAVTLVGALALIALGPTLIHLFYGARFAGASALLRILAVEAVGSSVTAVLIQTFSATGRPGIVTLLQGAGLALSVPLLFILIPHYGLIGAGLALLLSTLARLLLAIASYPLLLHVRVPRLIATKADFVALRARLAFRSAAERAEA